MKALCWIFFAGSCATAEAALRSGNRFIAVQLPENSFFRGLLYWKLSTYKEHEEIEPFVMHIGDGTVDPALEPLKTMFNHIEK